MVCARSCHQAYTKKTDSESVELLYEVMAKIEQRWRRLQRLGYDSNPLDIHQDEPIVGNKCAKLARNIQNTLNSFISIKFIWLLTYLPSVILTFDI